MTFTSKAKINKKSSQSSQSFSETEFSKKFTNKNTIRTNSLMP